MIEKLKNNFSKIIAIEMYQGIKTSNCYATIYIDATEDKKNIEIIRDYIQKKYDNIDNIKFIKMIWLNNKWVKKGRR